MGVMVIKPEPADKTKKVTGDDEFVLRQTYHAGYTGGGEQVTWLILLRLKHHKVGC